MSDLWNSNKEKKLLLRLKVFVVQFNDILVRYLNWKDCEKTIAWR